MGQTKEKLLELAQGEGVEKMIVLKPKNHIDFLFAVKNVLGAKVPFPR